jgi:peroxiredoxin
MPATYIIDQDGTIQLSYVQADYKNRLPVEALLANL